MRDAPTPPPATVLVIPADPSVPIEAKHWLCRFRSAASALQRPLCRTRSAVSGACMAQRGFGLAPPSSALGFPSPPTPATTTATLHLARHFSFSLLRFTSLPRSPCRRPSPPPPATRRSACAGRGVRRRRAHPQRSHRDRAPGKWLCQPLALRRVRALEHGRCRGRQRLLRRAGGHRRPLGERWRARPSEGGLRAAGPGVRGCILPCMACICIGCLAWAALHGLHLHGLPCMACICIGCICMACLAWPAFAWPALHGLPCMACICMGCLAWPAFARPCGVVAPW